MIHHRLISNYPCSWKELAKRGKEDRIPLKAEDRDHSEAVSDQMKAAVARRDRAKTNEEKLAAAAALEEARQAQRLV